MATAGSVLVFRLDGTPRSFRRFVSWVFVRLHPNEFEADPKDPFKHDKLSRRHHVEAFCSVLSGIEGPAVVLLDAPWGSGKTAFVRMCSAFLQSRDVRVVEFNAWRQQYTQRPLVDLVAAISARVSGPVRDTLRRNADAVAWHLAKVLTKGIIDREMLGSGPSMLGSWDAAKTAIDAFTKALGAATAEDRPLVVFVDELDRCRPAYALDLLEVVRHLFSVDGVVVVLAINRDQLRCAVGSLYGDKFRADRYLRRFADLHVGLPVPAQPDITTFLDGLLDATGLADRFGASTWFGQMMHLVVEHPECSLRDLEQATHLAAVVLSSLPDNDLSAYSAVALIVLRILDKDAYERFARHETDRFEAAAAINTALPGPHRQVTGRHPRADLRNARYRLDALLLRIVSRDEEHIDQLDTTTFEERYETATGCDREQASGVLAQVDALRRQFPGESVEIEQLAALIDLVAYTP